MQFGTIESILLELEPELSGNFYFKLWLCNELVWGKRIDDENVKSAKCSFVEFLYGLSSNLKYILHEQDFPEHKSPPKDAQEYISRVKKANNDFLDCNDDCDNFARILDEYCVFNSKHDISSWFDGLYVNELIAFRHSGFIVFTSGTAVATMLIEDAYKFFTDVGDFLCTHLSGVQYSDYARQEWERKSFNIGKQEYLDIALGGDTDEKIRNLVSEKIVTNGEQFSGHEYAIAARAAKLCQIEVQEIESLFQIIDTVTDENKERLEQIRSKLHQSGMDRYPSPEPHQYGYQLATAIRNHVDCEDSRFFDVEDFLLNVCGVAIVDSDFSASFDAIAVYGKTKGPTVFVNIRQNTRASTPNGRRTTLAHELCHFLVDFKSYDEPMDVLYKQSPDCIEKRANAFAAEVLLPRSCLINYLNFSDYTTLIHMITDDFKVSDIVAVWQINNSSYFTSFSRTIQQAIAVAKRKLTKEL